MSRSNYLIIIYCFIVSAVATARDSTAYSKDFIFREGIYVNYSQFRHNTPVEIKRIITGYDKTKLDFLTAVTSKKEIVYLDSLNNEIRVKSSEIWGYCQNQAVYINHNGEFFRVPVIGNIFHFIGYQYVAVGFMNPQFGYQQSPTMVKEQAQFMFDNHTQKVMAFNMDNLESILVRDEALYKEFTVLSGRKKRQSLFIYLRKYNEKHPLYFIN